MTTTSGKMHGWTTVAGIVQGATHVKQGKICQDAFSVGENADFVLACVADGHGSDRCPYSNEGAELAVQTASMLLSAMWHEAKDEAALLTALNDETRLARRLEAQWKAAVREQHVKLGRAPSLQDSAPSSQVMDEEAPPLADTFPYELYGTTLLAVLATEGFIFAVQIGDGDMVAVQADGMPTHFIQTASDCVGNETESLCLKEAWRYVRTRLVAQDGVQAVRMLLLVTDGYANSFVTESGFLQAGADICRLWQDEGQAYIAQNLDAWLAKTSEDGSGDDIAMAILHLCP